MFLQRHQVVQGIATRMHAGGNQTGEHTGNVGAVRRFVEERVLALPDEQLQGPLDQVVIQRGPGNLQKPRQRLPMGLHIGHRFAQRAVGFH